MGRLLVLLGSPGSGKSHLGALLARRLGLDWAEHEALWVQNWGSRETFVANKAAALQELEKLVRHRLERSPAGVVLESTGLSDRPMLERLARDHRLVIVRVLVPRALCVERVRRRAPGRHFDDDPESAGRFHDFWTRDISPRYAADLDVVNDAVDGDRAGAVRTHDIVERIAAILG